MASDFSDEVATDDSGNQFTMTTQYNPDGSVTYTDPDGSVYTVNSDGTYTTGSGSTEAVFDPKTGKLTGPGVPDSSWLASINKALNTNFSVADLTKLGIGAGGLAGLLGAGNRSTTPTGYQGGIPQLTAYQPLLNSPPMGRRPGSGGINYGTGVQYRDRNGNIVSDTSTPVDVLDNAARNNGFNQGNVYGQGTTGAGGIGGSAGGTSYAGILELLRRLGISGVGNTGGTSGVQGGGSPVTTSIAGSGGNTSGVIVPGNGGATPPKPLTPSSLADLKSSYDTLSKSGGKQSDLNAWIRAQMDSGMKDTDFQKITGYKLSDIQAAMSAAKNEGRTSGPDTRTGVVAGPGGDNRPTVDYGLKSQGYSRDYSPAEIINIRGTFLQNQNNPKALAALMNKYGVTMKDLALAQGTDVAGLTNYFQGQGVPTTDPIFQQGATSEEQKKFIAWQGEQLNPVTGRKIKEDWAARGITDPYSDPSLLTGAQKQIDTGKSRESMGRDPSVARPWLSTPVPTGAPTAAPPKTATEWASTPEGQKAGGLPGVYKSIQAYLATNPSAADLQKMMQTYGVDPATLQAAKDYNPAVTVGPVPVIAPPAAAAPTTAAEWANTPEGQKAGGIASVYGSINTYLATNPSATDLQNMMQTYGVTPAILQQAKDYNPNVVVGGGIVNPVIDTSTIDNQPNGPEPGPTGGIPDLVSAAAEMTPTGNVDNAFNYNQTGSLTPPPEQTTPFVRSGPTPEEEEAAIAAAQAAADSYAQSNQWYGFAEGGLTNLDHGGFVIPADVVSHFGNGSSSAGLDLLAQNMGATPIRGQGDGMSDSIPAAIDGREKALVANDEAYLSPQMVQRLGDGSMDAGSQKLARMMEQIRKARTGSKEQGKQIDPNKFMPGGMVGYAQGGGIKSYAGTTDPTASLVQAGVTGTEQNLSNWVGPYATQMLGQTQALANTPYQAYTGPLTAGASDLQTQAFNTAANLPGSDMATGFAQQAGASTYTPQSTNFGAAQAQQYMNPYLQASLNPQLDEARRQAEITNQQNNAAMTKAGAFGGGRQAIMTSENQRNLGTNLANITGAGYNTAYQNAMNQFNTDQNRQMQENQFGANYGLQGLQAGISGLNTANQMGINNLNTQASLGGVQRGIESEGMAADKAQFEEARKDPYTKLQFQQSMLNGLPITATNYNMSQPSGFQAAAGGAKTVNDLLRALGYTV